MYANLVSVLVYQAPADDKILRGEEEEAVVWEASDKLSGDPVPTAGEELGNKGCALYWQVEDISVTCDNGLSCHMSFSSTRITLP